MKLTAKVAYDSTISHRDDKVKELSKTAFAEIRKATRQGYFHVYIPIRRYSNEVITTVVNQFQKLGYVVKVNLLTIKFSWENVN